MGGAKKGRAISDEAVKAKTGKDWAGWFAVLDRAGAAEMTHAEIATLLHGKRKVPGWWCQMVAVRWEQERGRRKVLQTCRGDFAANRSRTLAAPLPAVFRAFRDAAARRRWLPDAPLEITTATVNKSIRARWGGTKERVSIYFQARAGGRSSVAVDHMGIPSQEDALRRKAWWGERLDRLRERVEG